MLSYFPTVDLRVGVWLIYILLFAHPTTALEHSLPESNPQVGGDETWSQQSTGTSPSRYQFLVPNRSRLSRSPAVKYTPYQLAELQGRCVGRYLKARAGVTKGSLKESIDKAQKRVETYHRLVEQLANKNIINATKRGDVLDKAGNTLRTIGQRLELELASRLTAEAFGNQTIMTFTESELARTTSGPIKPPKLDDQARRMREKISEIVKKTFEVTHTRLSPVVLVGALLPHFDNDPLRTLAAIAVATQEDTDQAVQEGKAAGISDPLRARSEFSKLNRYLETPLIHGTPNDSGVKYHYWGFALKQLTGGLGMKVLMTGTTEFFESDDPDERQADYSGRAFSDALKAAIAGNPKELKEDKEICPL